MYDLTVARRIRRLGRTCNANSESQDRKGLQMRFPQHAIRFSLVSAIVLTFGTPATFGEDVAKPVQTFQYTDASGDSFSAVSMVPRHLKTQAIDRHIIVVDTSASQVGTVREASLNMVFRLMSELPRTSQVRLLTVDVECSELTTGFVRVGSQEAVSAVQQLRRTTPLGATRLQSALRMISQMADGKRPISVLYIGDGMTSRETLSVQQMKAFTDKMVQQQISIHSLVLGPKTDKTVPSVLASLTGGTVVDVNSGDVADVSSSLQSAPVSVDQLIINGEAVQSENHQLMLRPVTGAVAYFRSDVDRMTSVQLKTNSGQTLSWNVDQIQAVSSGAILKSLVNDATSSEGVLTPVCSREALVVAINGYNNNVQRTIKVADYLNRQGRKTEAREYLKTAAASDDTNVTLQYMLAGMKTQEGFTNLAAPQAGIEDLPSPALAADEDPLTDVAQRIALQTQILKQNTDSAIDDATRISFDQPDSAMAKLKDIRETIKASRDVSDDVKLELETRVSKALSGVRNMRAVNDQKQRQIAEDEGVRLAVEAMLSEERIEDEKLANMIDQVRGLLDQARHGEQNGFEDAEVVSRTALELRPSNGPATQALVMSEALGQLDKAYRMVALRHDRFLETLYQVELSHVPFPDEPPVQYPPADVWRALTLTRVPKYESVDLRIEAPVETWLRKMLDKPIPPLDFPGETSLKEILDTIQAYYTTTFGAGGGAAGTDYRMTIYPDRAELDLEGISSLDDVLISDIEFQGMTLRSALKLIFEQTTEPELTYIIEDEVFKITTLAKAEDTLVTRVYPVADLVIPPVNLGGGQGGGQGGGLGGGQGGGQQGGGGGFGGGGGGQQGGGGFGGGLQSIPDDLLKQMADEAKNGFSPEAINHLKKKPVN